MQTGEHSFGMEENRVLRTPPRVVGGEAGGGALTAEGAVAPGSHLAGLGTQRCIGLQGAAEGQVVPFGPTLAIHTTGEAGLRRHHLVAPGERPWRTRQGGGEEGEPSEQPGP